MIRRLALTLVCAAALAAAPVAAKTAPATNAKTASKAASKPADPARVYPLGAHPETGADLDWSISLEVTNPGGTGLYLDSLWCEVQDLDPGETRAERNTRIDLSGVLKMLSSIPAQDSTVFQHAGPAAAEHARLTYTLLAHRMDGVRFTFATTVEVTAGASATAYPSQFLEVAGHKVEYVMVPALLDTGKTAGVLLVHGHASNARHSIRAARQLAQRGFSVLAVSMPGYGESDGPADFMGPRSVAAAAAALERLARDPAVDSTRLAAWGISRGATVVARLAATRRDLNAIVLQSGIYDLWAVYRGTELPGFKEAIVAEAGSDSSAWRERSPLLTVDRIGAATLILHGERDSHVPPGQAHAFYDALVARKAPVEAKFYPGSAHGLPAADTFRLGADFIRKQQAAR